MKKVIRCKECSDGYYIIKEGAYATFAGCTNYPECRSAERFTDLLYDFFELKGINIYSWDRVCWKCKTKIPVFTYLLTYDLYELDSYFQIEREIGLGDFGSIDRYLETIYPTIKEKYSRTTNSSYVANTCPHCGALQGRNYIVDDPDEIWDEYVASRGMEKYLVKTIPVSEIKDFKQDIVSRFSKGTIYSKKKN